MRWGIVLLKCKTLGSRNVTNSWKKMLIKQDVSIVLAINFHPRLDENEISESKQRHSNRHHYRF